MNFLQRRRERDLVKADSEFLSCVSRGMDGMVVNQIRWEDSRQAPPHLPYTAFCPIALESAKALGEVSEAQH